MVDPKKIQRQLKAIKFGNGLWNQAEIRELPNIIHKGEKISECVNGFYEGGIALLVATEMRLLLIDKKPLNYLTVEDFRFDTINEIDYSHRLMGATITISTGSKTLRFKSYNQGRLRNLITHVQQHMSNGKKTENEQAESQKQHLQEINKQLQMYLMAQHQQLQKQLEQAKSGGDKDSGSKQAVKPSPELSDYLFAQQLLEQFEREQGGKASKLQSTPKPSVKKAKAKVKSAKPALTTEDMTAAARREVFSKPTAGTPATGQTAGLEINPLKIAYSKLPMLLRNRRFGRAPLQATTSQQEPQPIPAAE